METSRKRPSDSEETSEQKRLSKCYRLVEKMPYEEALWMSIMKFTRRLPIDNARPTYEKVVNIFPSLGRYWKIYIEHEMKEKNYEIVEKLFQRCLVKTLDIDLFETYVSYIRESKSDLNSFREKMAQAYDFTLDKMGFHKLSYPFWVQYIEFLKTVTAVGTFAENQRITAIRRIYQKGITNPMKNLDELWKDYCQFETSINPLIGRKMQEDKYSDYVNAREVYAKYLDVTRDINMKMVCRLPGTFDRQLLQKKLWKEFINWEKSDPLNSKDNVIVAKRVVYAYEQCILCFGLHPDILLSEVEYIQEICTNFSNVKDIDNFRIFIEELERIFERAITGWMNKTSIVYYVYAEFAEKLRKFDLVNEIYKALIFSQADPTLTYIHYMNYSKRIESIKSYRNIFKVARHDSRCSYHIYVYSALMEFYFMKDRSIAMKIFELGYKTYQNDTGFLNSYFNFLLIINDDDITRNLFEKVVANTNLDKEYIINVWNNYYLFESIIGTGKSIRNVVNRRDSILTKDTDGTDDFALLTVERFAFKDLLPIKEEYLTTLYHRNSRMFGDKIKQCDPYEKEMFRPDLSQMKAYNPILENPLNEEKILEIKKRHSPRPSITVAAFLRRLPPASEYQGPLVDIEALLLIILQFDDKNYSYEGKREGDKIDVGTQNSIDIVTGNTTTLYE